MNDADTTPIDKYRDDKYFPYVPPFGDDASKPADLKNLYHLIYDPIANDYICALNPGTCKYLKIVDTTSKVADDNVDCD